MQPLQPGDLIAERFRVDALLGEGGIARVYRVRHVRLGSMHAVKILTLSRPSLADRLLLEGRIQAQLRHPNLVRVTDVVEQDGNPCLVMEYVSGSNLQVLLAEGGALPVEQALTLLSGVLSAVSSAHDVGVLHRDLKPANILLEEGRSGRVPKVSDFGIAKVATEDRMREGTTNVGVQMGTPGYMAPEQVHDSAQVDHRADIFALGAILYELLCGERPFVGDSTYSTLEATVHGRYQPLDERVPDCPPHVVAAIHRCLEPVMEDRFQSCHDLADALYAEHPALRARIQRLEEAAVPAGLHAPEQTDSTPRPPSDGPPGADAAASGATLLPEVEPAPPPRQLGPGSDAPASAAGSIPSPRSIGAGDTEELPLDTHAALVSPAAGADAPASSLSDISIGGEADSALLDEVEPQAAGSRTPLLLAVLAVILLGGGGWWWSQRGGGELEVEEVATDRSDLGEEVELPAAAAPPVEQPAAGEPAAGEPVTDEAPAEEPVTDEAPTEAPVTDEAPAEEPAAEEPAAEEPAAEEPVAEEPAAEEPAAEEPAAEEPAAEEPAGDAVADASPAAAEPAAEGPPAEEPPAEEPPAEEPPAEEPLPETAPATPAVRLAGTWQGEANGRPLTLDLTDAGDGRVAGELRFTQGAIERVARVTGSFDPESHRISLSEVGGAGLQFTGVVRGTGMMGTYGRRSGGNLSWSATRQ